MSSQKNKISPEDLPTWYESAILPVALCFGVFLLWTGWLFYGAAFAKSEMERHSFTKYDISFDQKRHEYKKEVIPVLPEDKKEVNKATIAENMTSLGQTGDAFGAFNAFFASLAAAAVIWAGTLQWKSLERARNAYSAERDHLSYERVESAFFSTLVMARETLNDVRFKVKVSQPPHSTIKGIEKTYSAEKIERIYKGAEAMDAIARWVHKRNDKLKNDDLVIQSVASYKERYAAQPSKLGPYWRLTFLAFQILHTANIQHSQKLQLAKIARAQMTEGTVLLLALNALTYYGWNFNEYIEEFGLLEHLHPAYMKQYKTALENGFMSKNSFLGSNDRKNLAENTIPKKQRFDAIPSNIIEPFDNEAIEI